MSVSISLFLDEIKFLESTAEHVLEDNFLEGWYINQCGFAELDISKATEDQKKILLRRLGGYNPELFGDNYIHSHRRLVINLNEILGMD